MTLGWGINDSKDVLNGEDIKIIGIVMFRRKKLDRTWLFEILIELDNIKYCT